MRIFWLICLLLIALPAGASKSGTISSMEVKLLSNPVGDHLRLYIKAQTPHAVGVQLEDLEGNQFKLGNHSVQGESWLTLSMGQIPTGLYILHIQHGAQTIQKRLLKQ